jgi:NAD+ diphosphatase
MIQDIEPHIFHNEFDNPIITDNDYLLSYRGKQILIYENDGEIELPRICEVTAENPKFLFRIDDRNYYIAQKAVETDKYKYKDTSILRWVKPMWKAFAAATGEQLYRWYTDHKFCGRCASKLQRSKTERALVCPSCGHTIYPDIAPSVIVAVTDGDKILMTKYAHGHYNKYALVAGYNEIGEDMEHTVIREVMEEVGLRVKNIRYYKSQPWMFTSTMLMGFFCELDGSPEIKLDRRELSEAVWFERDKIPVNDSRFSLTNEMIEVFRRGEHNG